MTGTSRTLPQDERRSAPRGRLVLRIAKLVCQSGEYPCVVRDVSLSGAGLAFFHDVPPEERVILQLSNGATFPVERVWSGAGRAGYRFAVPVAEEDFIASDAEFGHRPLRLAIRAAATVIDGRERAEARLLDLSAEGAKIAVAGPYASGRVVSLALPGHDPRLAEVRWAGEGEAGVRFFEPLSTAQLAALALALQPFAAPAGTDGQEKATQAA
ncbi:PilZ domain-containing protein [Erythrobacter sp.]|uniref:PilZ domain-containing protein n=1 Tax=Erythrobacter sp. TaxID=1042 RepID=UPI001425FEC6|nr:PilZ domain-containing protein [Erythrobacter sp.]QIQ87347.1 MAG: PilZ domain-containing protein [Erythrobacter sp.]